VISFALYVYQHTCMVYGVICCYTYIFLIYLERPLFTQKNIPREHFRAYLMRVLHFLQASTFLVRVCGVVRRWCASVRIWCVCCWTICELRNYSEWSVEKRGSKHKTNLFSLIFIYLMDLEELIPLPRKTDLEAALFPNVRYIK